MLAPNTASNLWKINPFEGSMQHQIPWPRDCVAETSHCRPQPHHPRKQAHRLSSTP
ncbi:uncharacterized protein G2W53_004504 [Senna tora]|uniref:Uncharacterized protein n=1 Tax=Senna tora TaxID=362788 RepID=A0A835CI48_9FABA|nr:uncharacterized protein G2W53_004504 [Senna tora]